MAPGTIKSRPARKRRRRQQSYTPSSSDDSSSGEDAQEQVNLPEYGKESTSGSSSSSDGSNTGTDDDSDSGSIDSASSLRSTPLSTGSRRSGNITFEISADQLDQDEEMSHVQSEPSRGKLLSAGDLAAKGGRKSHRPPTLSPSPSPRDLPSFMTKIAGVEEDERRLQFRRVYMDKLVEGFGDELEKLRSNDPSLAGQRLQHLIDSLASGIDVFDDGLGKTSMGSTEKGSTDEIGLILGSQ